MANENDVVLIYFEDKPAIFARIESIEPDIKRGWYHVTLLLLTIPMQTVTWILRDGYIEGSPFTMGGRAVRLEPVKKEEKHTNHQNATESGEKTRSEGSATLIPFKKT